MTKLHLWGLVALGATAFWFGVGLRFGAGAGFMGWGATLFVYAVTLEPKDFEEERSDDETKATPES